MTSEIVIALILAYLGVTSIVNAKINKENATIAVFLSFIWPVLIVVYVILNIVLNDEVRK